MILVLYLLFLFSLMATSISKAVSILRWNVQRIVPRQVRSLFLSVRQCSELYLSCLVLQTDYGHMSPGASYDSQILGTVGNYAFVDLRNSEKNLYLGDLRSTLK